MNDTVIVQKLRKGDEPIKIQITQEQLSDLKSGKQVRGTMVDLDENGVLSTLPEKIFIMPHIESWELVSE